MRFLNEAALNAADVSATVSSSAIDAAYLVSCSVQAVVVDAPTPEVPEGDPPAEPPGDATGTLKLQFSNEAKPSTWSDVANASISVSGDGTYIIGKTDLCFRWVRLSYVRTSGAGTMTANLQALGF